MRIGNALSILLPLAILLGIGTGKFLPNIGERLVGLIDPLVLCLLALMFFEVRFTPLRKASNHLGFLSLAWVTNFILIPVLGWGLASLFFGSQPALFATRFEFSLNYQGNTPVIPHTHTHTHANMRVKQIVD